MKIIYKPTVVIGDILWVICDGLGTQNLDFYDFSMWMLMVLRNFEKIIKLWQKFDKK